MAPKRTDQLPSPTKLQIEQTRKTVHHNRAQTAALRETIDATKTAIEQTRKYIDRIKPR